MTMTPYRVEGGIMVPRRAEAGPVDAPIAIGDGYELVHPTEPEYLQWDQYLQHREERDAAELGKVDEGAVGRYKARNLIKWFNRGADGQIPWGVKGDFEVCTRLAIEHGKMTPEQAHGFCNLRHKDATGAYPGHAAGEVHKSDAADYPITNPHAAPDYDPAALGIKGGLRWTEVDPQVPNVDRQHYQRDLDTERVKLYEDMPKKQLKQRVGLLARRPDGSLWTIDGQHHTLAAIGRGIAALPYQVFDSTGPDQEAKVYKAWNSHEQERRNA